MTTWRGAFSFFSYDVDGASPPLPNVWIATTLIGAGGVGAGVIRTIAALGSRVSGTLNLVASDVLTPDNLNRLSYATLAGTTAGMAKVVEAEAFLRLRWPKLEVSGYKRRSTPTKLERRGGQGVEPVEFGRYGCRGCSRRAAPVTTEVPAACGAPPDPRAPSLSFLSSFPGILAAGEVMKEATGHGSLRGRFDHLFRYGPNPGLVGMPAMRSDCQVGCGRPGKLDQYRQEYPGETLR